MIKTLFSTLAVCALGFGLAGCSTNLATGKNQFTALMSPQQENAVGAQEHSKIIAEFGLYDNSAVQDYITRVGTRVVQGTERADVQYKFYVLDSPIVNAFALPGGYIYITRGLLALANSEAEMASVLAHEAGHITGRHSAERYSRSIVTGLGAAILSTALDSQAAAQALGLGSQLYLTSYSRDQEHEADGLGVRYLTRAGYYPSAAGEFLYNLQADASLQAKLAGQGKVSQNQFFATHPATSDRIIRAHQAAHAHGATGVKNENAYLQKIDGIIYGDSPDQGLVRGDSFIHPALGFKFTAPQGYRIINQPNQVVAAGQDGAALVFDIAKNTNNIAPSTFIRDIWMKDQPLSAPPETTQINGMNAATAAFQGALNGKPMSIRVVAITWRSGQVARFQVAMPLNASAQQEEGLRRAVYSFARLTQREKDRARPYRLDIVTASAGDSVATLSTKMPEGDYKVERFRVLNGLKPQDTVKAGALYKIVK